MKPLYLLLVSCALSFGASSQNYESFREKGKWGFKSGKKIVIKPRFDEVVEFWASSPNTLVRIGRKFGVIDRKGDWFIEPMIDSIEEVTFPHNYELDGKWRIAYSRDYDYILNYYDYRKLDSFPDIQRMIAVREKNPYFNPDYSDPKDEYQLYMTPPEEPYVIISKFDERKQAESAVYELTARMRISPWIALDYDENLKVQAYHFDTITMYVYSDCENSGYYMTGMEYGTPLKFSDIRVENSFVLLRESKKEAQYQLYQWTGEYLALLSGTYAVRVTEEEGGGRYFYQLEDGKGHYGFVSPGGKIFAPQYDSLFLMPGFSDILQTRIQDKYGVVSLSSDYELREKSTTPIRFEGYNYMLFNSGAYLSFTDEKGQKYFADVYLQSKYKFNPKSLFSKAEKGFYYLMSSDTINGKRIETKVWDTKFLHVDTTRIEGYIKVKNSAKKYGMLNLKGDTLLPFEFENFDLFNWDGDGNQYIRVKQKGKWALYYLNGKQIVPVFYDKILESDFDDYDNLIITAKGKVYGLNAADGAAVLPQQFDRILTMRSQDDRGDYILGSGKGQYTVAHIQNRFLDSASAHVITKEYDFILKDRGYIRIGEQYETYDLLNDHASLGRVPENDIAWEEEGSRIAVKNGRLGVINSSGETLVPFDYELLCFTRFDKKRVMAFRQGEKSYINLDTGEETADDFYNGQYK